MPLLLAALPEHRHLFRSISRNPFLAAEAIDVYPDDLSIDALRERAWALMLPHYLKRLGGLVERFGAARSVGLGGRIWPRSHGPPSPAASDAARRGRARHPRHARQRYRRN